MPAYFRLVTLVTLVVRVPASRDIQDPPDQDRDHDDGDESPDQRPVHGAERYRSPAPARRRPHPSRPHPARSRAASRAAGQTARSRAGRLRRGGRPVRWPTGTPMPPGACAPGGTRSEAGSAAAARRGEPAGRSSRGRSRRSRTDGSGGRSNPRSALWLIPDDQSPFVTSTPRRLTLCRPGRGGGSHPPATSSIKANFTPCLQSRFPENATTSRNANCLEVAGIPARAT